VFSIQYSRGANQSASETQRAWFPAREFISFGRALTLVAGEREERIRPE
jgi:hypothetical protein